MGSDKGVSKPAIDDPDKHTTNMSQPKQKRQASKTERQNFFGQNAAQNKYTNQQHQQDGGEETHDSNLLTDPADQTMEEP
ncbi:Hypothetical predicted protein, partial [Pelobates cultripes]